MKSRVLQVRLPEDVYVELVLSAEREGLSLSDYVRPLLLRVVTVPVPVFEPLSGGRGPGYDPNVFMPTTESLVDQRPEAGGCGPRVLKAVKEVKEGWKPDPRLSKDHAVRGKGRKK